VQLFPLKLDSCILVRLSFRDVWGSGEAYTGFWWGNLREIDHLGDAGVDGRNILRWIFRKWDVGMDWIELVQDRDRW
jgi:hypothetical protein